MKIKSKPIESVRIRKDRAEALKAKAFEISIKAGEIVTEADLVNFLIDTQLDRISIDGEKIVLEDL